MAGETNQPIANGYAENILKSLRRIIRAIDLHSRELSARFNLTVPQLVCLRQLYRNGDCSPGDLARFVSLSQATLTGIIDRLENRALVTRQRGQTDRRKVLLSLTPEGRRMAETMPWPLQERFAERLFALPRQDQAMINRVLDQIVHMMEAQDIDAWPIVGAGEWSDLSDLLPAPEKEP
ncbi:MarR family winged helix-turn-helix transcriptional regulator [Desulfatitalea alkaliphila]|uniref:MarR family transcriptional regulator n=1 Tax=Desulfatitalea alkaliphila TaxID=2929485 RepID=A0AA41ULL4_9BACT|nr:MarR family transcriptional regulator [Desulfatitalea alkaliphila]MCJ8502542.1 MarR family transcriptional regulator [Desulfatitalea alkaliphila]